MRDASGSCRPSRSFGSRRHAWHNKCSSILVLKAQLDRWVSEAASPPPVTLGPAGRSGPAGAQGSVGAIGAQGPVGVVDRWTSFREFVFEFNRADIQPSVTR